MTVDKWAAEQCGVTERKHKITGDPVWYVGEYASTTILHIGKWSIKKADCREIVREHFRIETARSHWEGVEPDYWISAWPVDDSFHEWTGSNIEEVEIAAITAIYEDKP